LAILLDTSVAIHLRDGDVRVRSRFAELDQTPVLSIVTIVELEAGAIGVDAARRRAGLELMVREIDVRAFGRAHAEAYGRIIAEVGFSRRKVLDRMIATQALIENIPLITLNPADFRDVPGLRLIEW
jgi:predicted nucleic acid-binding protein